MSSYLQQSHTSDTHPVCNSVNKNVTMHKTSASKTDANAVVLVRMSYQFLGSSIYVLYVRSTHRFHPKSRTLPLGGGVVVRVNDNNMYVSKRVARPRTML